MVEITPEQIYIILGGVCIIQTGIIFGLYCQESQKDRQFTGVLGTRFNKCEFFLLICYVGLLGIVLSYFYYVNEYIANPARKILAEQGESGLPYISITLAFFSFGLANLFQISNWINTLLKNTSERKSRSRIMEQLDRIESKS